MGVELLPRDREVGIAESRGDGNLGTQMWTRGPERDMLVTIPRQSMAKPSDQLGSHCMCARDGSQLCMWDVERMEHGARPTLRK